LRKIFVVLVSVATSTGVVAASASAASGGPAERALSNVQRNADRTHFGQGQQLSVRDVITDGNGTEHVRLDRTYRGLAVLGGDLVVHERSSGELRGLSQTLARDLSLSTRPAVARAEAIRVAESRFNGDRSSSSAGLVVYATGEPRLAYEAVVTGTLADGSPSELHVIVDATNGNVLNTWDAIESGVTDDRGFFNGLVDLTTTLASGSYSLKDPTRGNQYTCDSANKQTSRCTSFTDADDVWGNGALDNRQTTAVDAQYGTAVTWDYYKGVHGRIGIANDGKGAYNRVHYGRNYNNAFWSDSCFCMTYGDGDGTTYNPFDSLDVAGHEMSHGVTSRTANLTYSGESGGLNEANSDIFGTMVEYYAGNPNDTPDYKIGEKLYRSNAGETRALRYMYKPSGDGSSPDCWSPTIGSLDVHRSSGPANHFFYLLAEGSSATATVPGGSPTCNGQAVAGITRQAAEQIWYRALTVYMTSGTNYAGARAATLSAAADLYGGTASAQYDAVAAAWAAVSVG
jgi:Zn-dependent metalloprotease